MIVQKRIYKMFFIIGITFIIQLLLLVVIISVLLNVDIDILLLTDKFQDYNNKLIQHSDDINKFSLKFRKILNECKEKYRRKKRKFFIAQSLNLLEWGLIGVLKPKAKKLIIGYKAGKYIIRKLSLLKNMV